jgi:hypothetical protein
MKRYRILSFDFDARANLLSIEIKDSMDEKNKKLMQDNKSKVIEGLIDEYGVIGSEQKIKNFIDLGASPVSVIAFHNNFLRQARDAFVVEAYYPALTASCALGERILNQLIIHLREDFKATEEYKKIYRKDSFDNWDLAIDTLESWDVLLPKVISYFRELKNIRNSALHFNPETDVDDRKKALEALRKLTEIIQGQFAGFGIQPWYIPKAKGISVIKKDAEGLPFVRRILLPSCCLVGYKHKLKHNNGKWLVDDNHDYIGDGLTDKEYIKLFEEHSAIESKKISDAKANAYDKNDKSESVGGI